MTTAFRDQVNSRSVKKLNSLPNRDDIQTVVLKCSNAAAANDTDSETLKSLMRVVSKLPALEDFRLQNAALFSVLSLKKLFRNRTNFLKSLVLIDVTLEGATLRLKELSKQMVSLESIRLVNCRTHDDNDLHDGNIDNDDDHTHSLWHLVDGIAELPQLKSVIVSNCSTPYGPAEAALTKLVSSSSHNKNQLENLTVKECFGISSETFIPAIVALSNNTKLKNLTVTPEVGVMTDDCLQAIGNMLAVNQTLQCIECCCSNANNLLPIANGLQVNRSLKSFRTLDLPNFTLCPRDEPTQEALTRALRDNMVLEVLGKPGARGFNAEIDLYLRANRFGRLRLYQAPKEEWIAALSNNLDVDMIYCLLSCNPGLCQTTTTTTTTAGLEEETKSRKQHRGTKKRKIRHSY